MDHHTLERAAEVYRLVSEPGDETEVTDQHREAAREILDAAGMASPREHHGFYAGSVLRHCVRCHGLYFGAAMSWRCQTCADARDELCTDMLASEQDSRLLEAAE